MNGERPSRPQGVEKLGLTDALWKMTEYCWKHPPKDRLKSSEVVDLLREMWESLSFLHFQNIGTHPVMLYVDMWGPPATLLPALLMASEGWYGRAL